MILITKLILNLPLQKNNTFTYVMIIKEYLYIFRFHGKGCGGKNTVILALTKYYSFHVVQCTNNLEPNWSASWAEGTFYEGSSITNRK